MARRNGGHSPPLSIPLAALIALIYLHTKPLKTCGRNFSWLWRTLKALKGWIKASGAGGRCPCPASSACTFCIRLADFCRAGGRSSCLAWLWSPACPGPCPSSTRARSPSSSTPPPCHHRFSTGWRVHWLHFRRTCSIYVVPLQAKPLINILHTF